MKMMLWFGFFKDGFRLLAAAALAATLMNAQAAPPAAIPVFADDFESGTTSLWTTTVSNPLDPSTAQNVVPAGGQFSALMNTSLDRMHHNIIADNGGIELDGHILFTCWIYDLGVNSGTVGATRIFNEIRGYSGGTGLPNGGTTASGTLAQLLAVGKFNSVTLPGEVFTATKYQGRVAFHTPQPAGDTGWLNLNGPGSPNRSVGWHRFDIEVMPGGTTVRFYVDGILSRTFNGATAATYDTVILGPGLGSQQGDAWIDGMSVGRVDLPPVLNCPDKIDVCTCSPNGTNVTYIITATDDTDTNVTVVCNPPSGSFFPVGTTIVTCTARDDSGNTSECSFPVNVILNTVAILCPPDLKVFTCSNSAVVNYNVGAANRCGRSECIVQDNGTGTATLPARCPFDSAQKMMIVDGLPAGTTVQLAPVFHTFVCQPGLPTPCLDCFVQDDCDPRNGELVAYESTLELTLEGTGGLAGYRRTIVIPHVLERSGHRARNPGDPIQSFDTEMLQLQGQLPPGDPDFDLLRITGGTDFGLPSPGHTTLTRVPTGWVVDSFFDITYRIDFVGSPGGPLAGRSGSTTGTIRIRNNTEPTITCNPPSGSSFPIGTTTITCRAVNDCGFSDSCEFKVTVETDQEPPRLNCPEKIEICTCSPDGTNVTYVVTATDNADTNVTIVCNPPSGSFFPPGTTIVTCTARDDCGNTTDCSFPVTVVVNRVAILCPQDMRVFTCSNSAVVNFTVSAANRCTPASGSGPVVVCNPPSGSSFPPGITTVSCIASNECGFADSCQFKVSVEADLEPPRINCPEKIEICTCNPNGTNVTYVVTATDDADTNVTVVCNPPSGSFFPPGTTIVTCTARDDCGKSSDCSFPVTVIVNTVAIVCPPDMTVVTCSNRAVVNYAVTAQNRCGDSSTDARCLAPTNGTGTARLPADCPFGSNEKMAIVDGLPPASTIEISPLFHSFACSPMAPVPPPCPNCYVQDDCNPSNGEIVLYESTATLQFEGTGMFAGYTRTFILPHMLEKDGYAARTPVDPVQSFATEKLQLFGQITGDPDFDLLRITAGSDFGLPSPGHTTLTLISTSGGLRWVVDSFFDITYRIDFVGRPGGPFGGMSGSTTGTIRIRNNAASGAPAVVCNPPSGSSFPLGTTTVTCRATNECGFSDSCQFTVTVRSDNEPPQLACPEKVEICTCGPNGTNVTYTITATDNLDTNVTIVCNPPSGSFFPPGTTIVTCAARDDCGNTTDCSFPVTVTVNRVAIICPPDMKVFTCSNSAVVTYVVGVANRCAGTESNVTVICSPPSGSSFPIGTTTVTCRATNECGFSDSCQFRVTVEADQEPPRIICPNGIAAWTCGDGAVVNYTVTATDDHDTNVTIVCNPPSGSVFPVGVTIVTCIATDDCGKTDRCEFPVRVIRDTEPPRIVCPSNIVVFTCRTNARVHYSVSATDDCDTNVTIVCTPPSGSLFPLGTTTVHCIATDDCGNKDECRFEVLVRHEEGPRLTIRRAATTSGFLVCWPAPSPGWRLQCSPTLNVPDLWQNVTNTPVLMGSQWCVLLPNDARHRFYRLCKPCDPVITGVSHLRPREGDVLTITGAGFGNNPDDLCVVIVERSLITTNGPGDSIGAGLGNGVRYIPLRALSAKETSMTARMGPVPPDAKPGHIMVGHGIGQVGRFQPAFPDILLEEPVWTWNKFGPAGMGEEIVEPQPEPNPPASERCFHSGPPENGELCVFIQGDWGTNCYISIVARAHDSVSDTGGHDLDAPTVRFLNPGTTRDCVERIVDVLRCAFQQQAGVMIDVTFEEVPPGSGVFKITVRIPGGYIDRGMLSICVRCPE